MILCLSHPQPLLPFREVGTKRHGFVFRHLLAPLVQLALHSLVGGSTQRQMQWRILGQGEVQACTAFSG